MTLGCGGLYQNKRTIRIDGKTAILQAQAEDGTRMRLVGNFPVFSPNMRFSGGGCRKFRFTLARCRVWPRNLSRMVERCGASLARRSAVVVGLDADCPSLWENRIVHHRLVGDCLRPFKNCVFDLISAKMVVTVVNPELVAKNLNRMLTPGNSGIPDEAGLMAPSARQEQPRERSRTAGREGRLPHVLPLNTAEAGVRGADRIRSPARRSREFHAGDFALGPVALLVEMLIISVLEFRWCSRLRSNLVVVLKSSNQLLTPSGARIEPRRAREAVGLTSRM